MHGRVDAAHWHDARVAVRRAGATALRFQCCAPRTAADISRDVLYALPQPVYCLPFGPTVFLSVARPRDNSRMKDHATLLRAVHLLSTVLKHALSVVVTGHS